MNYRTLMKNCVSVGSVTIAAFACVAGHSYAQSPGKVKIGFMLPYSGTFAPLGVAITNGFKLAVDESGGKIAGREVEYVSLDDESDPAKATDNANRLIKRDNVDLIIGTVHSGVGAALAKVAKDSNTLLLVPNAGANEITGVFCAPNIFRTSFSNWQPSYALGEHVAKSNLKTVVTLTWKYSGGDQIIQGFKESYEKNGGKIVKELYLPFPNTEFQSYLTEIAALKPSAVYVFFAGGGAVKFMKDYEAAGLKKTIPLYAVFLTDGTIDAAGPAAQGIVTTLHYGDGLTNPKNVAFRKDYAIKYKLQPDSYAVQGYDSAQLFIQGMNAVKGDLKKRADLVKAMETAKVNSPRGMFTMSKAHNPIQDIYVRKVIGTENVITGVAVKALEDPAKGCRG